MVYGELIYDDIELRSSEVALVQEALAYLLEEKQGELEKQDDVWSACPIDHDIAKIKLVREKLREITGGD